MSELCNPYLVVVVHVRNMIILTDDANFESFVLTLTFLLFVQ